MVILAVMIAGGLVLGATLTRWLDRLPRHPNDWQGD